MLQSVSHFVIALAAGALAASAQNPTADQILDRYVEVTGGKELHAKVKGESVTGTMEMKAQGIKGKMSGYKNGKGDSYNIVEIDGVGKIEEGFLNGVAWEKSAMAGPRIKTGEEKAFVEREAHMSKDLNWREVYSKAEVQGTETIDGVECFKVVLTPKNSARTETRFYEKASGLLRRTELVTATQMGDLPVVSTTTSYKDFGGMKFPSAIVTKMAGQEMVITILGADFAAQPDSRFALPPDVKALADKQKP